MVLRGKKILLGITGGIAAYKTTFLVRLFIKAGAEVQVIMTPTAGSFVSPLTLATLSKHPVVTSFVKEEGHTTDWNNHVALGIWADVMVIAPATANTMAKMANGASDNLLLATYLSATCPVLVAPAMDLDMYQHPATKKSMKTLESYGNIIIPASSGELASGLHGEGRMAEPEEIVTAIQDHLSKNLPLSGLQVLITAGPTYEAIDPVRFLGNRSSGRMGYALAETAAKMGANVILVTGPTALTLQDSSIETLSVESAQEMYEVTLNHFATADIVIAAAAVSDYRPVAVQEQKIKKTEETLNITLVKNKDILKAMGDLKKKDQFLVGFALETHNELENAKSKLQKKNLDAIVLNSLNDSGAGFGTTTNKITFIDKNLNVTPFELKTKSEVAFDILNQINALRNG